MMNFGPTKITRDFRVMDDLDTDVTEAKLEYRMLKEIMYPEIEPGVINIDMLRNAYQNCGYKGEEERLHKTEEVDFERITTMRLEFKNILRIDHLWIMPNLTKLCLNNNKIEVIEHLETLTSLRELNLSFNYIEKIENLNKLVNLEELSLYSNLITTIENLDSLEKLVILSLGENKLCTVKGIERFRFLKKLRVLNLEENPYEMPDDFRMAEYVAAVVPQVKYYAYELITNEIRETAEQKYSRELRDIITNEENEVNERNQRHKDAEDEARLACSFVEYLNEHQLYQSLWKDDEDGRILMKVDLSTLDLRKEYDNEIYAITQELYKLGLQKYEERQKEIKDFLTCREEGIKSVQLSGQRIIEEFTRKKEKIFANTAEFYKNYEISQLRGETLQQTSEEEMVVENFFEKKKINLEELIINTWHKLLGEELHLHEAIEEATMNFIRNMEEMIARFVEIAQTHFIKIREIAINFSENIMSIASDFVLEKMAMQDFTDVEEELMPIMGDRDALMSLVSGMKDAHIQRIDEREDRIITRSKAFVEKLLQDLQSEEFERNRNKITEISAYLDVASEQFDNLPEEVRLEVLHGDT